MRICCGTKRWEGQGFSFHGSPFKKLYLGGPLPNPGTTYLFGTQTVTSGRLSDTEDHEIILASGAAAASFTDNVSCRAFDNSAEFEELYGNVPKMEERPYPSAMSARQAPPTSVRASPDEAPPKRGP